MEWTRQRESWRSEKKGYRKRRRGRGGQDADVDPYLPPQSILEAFDALLQRPIKLQFLQVVAPGQVYPPRGSGGGRGPNLSPTTENNLFSGETGPSRRFPMQDLGLAWETVETLHFFMYPGGCGSVYYMSCLVVFLAFSSVSCCELHLYWPPCFQVRQIMNECTLHCNLTINFPVHCQHKRTL